jgi:SPP1 gp7 family putative phage head morphogenesis protein
MTVRLDQARPVPIEELRARRTMREMALGRRLRRRRRVPPQALPRGQELRYRMLLLGVLDEVDQAVRSEILPLVERLTAQVQQQRPDARLDAPADDLEDATESLRDRLATTTLSANALQTQTTTIGRDVAGHNRRQLDRVFESTIGVGLPGVEPALNDVLRGFVRENARRIRNLGNEAVDRVSAAVLRGFRRGRSPSEIAAEVRSELGVSRSRARLIARDQVASLNGELTQIRQTSMGVSEYVWRTVGDERVRPAHEDLDGRRFSWDSPPAEGHPGEPINCRCIAEPVLDQLFEGL